MIRTSYVVLAWLCLLLVGCSGASQVEQEVSYARVDPFIKIVPESNFFPEFSDTVEVAAGEHATFQFAVRSGWPIDDMQIRISGVGNAAKKPLGKVSAGLVNYVSVGRPAAVPAGDAVVSLSRYYPDPIISQDEYSLPRDVAQAVWATIEVPAQTEPDVYKARISLLGRIDGNPFRLTRTVYIKVYPVVLEQPTLWVSNWIHTTPEVMAQYNGGQAVEPYSDRWWELMRMLTERMRDGYQNVVMVSPIEHVGVAEYNGKYTFDYTQFDKLVSLYREAGVMRMLEGGHLAGRLGGWESDFGLMVPEVKEGKKEVRLYPLSDTKAQAFYKQFVPDLMQHIKQKGWDSMYYQHIADEPIAANVQSYVRVAKFIKSLAPGIRLIEACQTPDLQGLLDIWIPQLDYYQQEYPFYTGRQAKGNQVWFYTCVFPQGEYVNRFIEQPLIKTRLIHWLNYRYGATGYLHWGFNHWGVGNPLGETTVMHGAAGLVLPGGDSWLVYPKDGKLYGSMRLEAMRDGIADYTLLQMLAKKDAAKADALCKAVLHSWQVYDTDPNHFRQIRRQLLEELSK